ncbi:unnamed protein product, partial [Phaeothamnion confervicola]
GEKAGAVLVGVGATAMLRNCTFERNQGRLGGGAVASSGDLTVKACRFKDNASEAGSGSAIASIKMYAATIPMATVAITGSEFEGNVGRGGAVAIGKGGMTMLARSVFRENIASDTGGALWLAGGVETISDCSFLSNAAGIIGGAIHVRKTSTGIRRLMNTLFRENSAVGSAGAMAVEDSVGLLDNVTFERNRAGLDGGALFI